MNILPIVIGMLALFVMIASSFIQGQTHVAILEKAYVGFGQANRDLLSKIEQERFRTIAAKKKDTNSSAPRKETPRDREFSSSRTRKLCDEENSKLNLSAISKQKTPIAYETAARLLDSLYGHTKFFAQNTDSPAERLLDELLKQCEKSSPEAIEDLYKKDSIEPIWYKVFHGTKKYDLKKKVGYPPLHHFFTIQPKQKKAICFLKASKTLLDAHFGEEAASAIIDREKQKWEDSQHKKKTLTRAELEQFLSTSYSKLPNWSQLLEEMSYSSQTSKKKRFFAQDAKTGISCEEGSFEEASKL